MKKHAPSCSQPGWAQPVCLFLHHMLLGADTFRLAGGSADPQSMADAETGPSPAAPCGVPPSGGNAHHRVVRRLDQHEAWGGTRASPSKHPYPGDSTTKREGLAGSGTGFSLFSPVKKQRVPLFNDASSIKVGATPSKPDGPGERVWCAAAPDLVCAGQFVGGSSFCSSCSGFAGRFCRQGKADRAAVQVDWAPYRQVCV